MTSSVELDEEAFSQVIRLAPLVSIDLILRDADRKVLVGIRNNEPGEEFLLRPGRPRAQRGALEAAFARIMAAETGVDADFTHARFLGVYQHIYPNNRFGHSGYGTHYVVLPYELNLPRRPFVVLDSRHCVDGRS